MTLPPYLRKSNAITSTYKNNMKIFNILFKCCGHANRNIHSHVLLVMVKHEDFGFRMLCVFDSDYFAFHKSLRHYEGLSLDITLIGWPGDDGLPIRSARWMCG